MKLVHWLLMGGLLHLVQQGGDMVSHRPPRPLLAVPNVTAHPSMASVPITVLMVYILCPLMGGLLHLVQQGGAWVVCSSPCGLYQM